MTRSLPRGTGVALTLVVVLGLEVIGLRSGTTGYVLVGAIAGIALLTLLFQVSLERVAVGAACASAATLTWNGIFLGPERPGDLFVLLGLLFFVMARPNDGFATPPWWIKQLGAMIIAVAVIQMVVPPDVSYLSNRVVLGAAGQIESAGKITASKIISSNMGVSFKFLVGVVAIPMVYSAAVIVERRAVRWLTVSFVAGTALNGWAATTDRFVGTHFGALLTSIPNVGGRQFGFSDHPNFLAAGLVLATPLAVYLASTRQRWDKIIGWAALPGLVGGTYASGSRGGAVCVVLAILLTCAVLPRTRPYLPGVLLGGAVAAGGIVAFVPSLGHTILEITRLSGGIATAGSNTVRNLVGHQGVLDWQHSPIWGIDYDISDQASQVYLQELASGGLLLFGAMTVYSLGAIVDSWALRRQYALALALMCSIVASLALNFFEADLTDRFYYVSPAILAALLTAHRRGLIEPDHPIEEPARLVETAR
jgi:hypothetical protein